MNLTELENSISSGQLPAELLDKSLVIEAGARQLALIVSRTLVPGKETGSFILPFDLIRTAPAKVMAMLRSKLGLNTTVFARNCEVKKPGKDEAALFLETYHLMGSTQSAFAYGLFYKGELIAVATFSKGRKMNRLPADKRSFELIRFCSKAGISVAGGLTKLVRNFCRDKNAGDVMTYIDRQFSKGESFLKAGFAMHSRTPPAQFLVNRQTFERAPYEGGAFDEADFYMAHNAGNLKMIFTP